MPRLSDTMDSGTIARWLKAEGEPVKRGEIIAEIETDKSNMELESYASGILARIVVKEGESANLGQPIALIAKDEAEAAQLRDGGGGDESVEPERTTTQRAQSQGLPQPAQEQPSAGTLADTQPTTSGLSSNGQAPTEEAPRAEPGGRIKASPLAKRLASEHGINLHEVAGTGPGGRITKDDVQGYMKSQPSAGAPARREPEVAEASRPAVQAPAITGGGAREGEPVELTRMQATISRRLTEARFTAPDFLLTSEIDMTEARAFLKSVSVVEGAPKVGPNDLLIKAAGVALTQHRNVNAGWEGGTIVRYGRINVGNAVATPSGGLIVPVIGDADRKTLGQIASESKALIDKARNNKLAPNEYEGGTFTISNLGMFGIDQFTSILNPPEACSLAVGAIVAKPVVVDGEIVVRDRMRVTLTCDHRVVNGAEGADFLRTLRRLLENPMLALL
jgi:pyruvate dehydrogenase E2 component (dihydrolipoyllysine-residue acetyltransferase)